MAKQSNFLITMRFLPLFFSLFIFCNVSLGFEIGVNPAILQYDDVLRNSSFSDQVVIFNSNNFSVALYIKSVNGFVVKDKEEIIVEARSSKKIIFRVFVNESLSNGLYEDYLLLSFLAIDNTGNIYSPSENVAFQNGVGVKIIINVNDNEIRDYIISKTIIKDSEVNSILSLELELENKGNIVIKNNYSISIFDRDNKKMFIDNKEISLQINENFRDTFYYNTSGFKEGKYKSIVIIGDNYTREIYFTLFSEGTFTRKGNFDSFSLDNTTIIIDKPLKIEGLFSNNGKLLANAQLIIEVYLNKKLIDILRSEEFLVEQNEHKRIIIYYILKEYGDYSFIGKIIYNKKETEPKEIIIKLSKNGFFYFITGNIVSDGYGFVKNNIIIVEVILLAFIIIFVAWQLAKK